MTRAAVLALAALLPSFTLFSPAARARHHRTTFAPPPVPIVRPPSAEDEAHLLGDPLTVVRTVRQMPVAVQKALGLPTKHPLSEMADPGMRFSMSDAGNVERLPYQRLVLAATDAQYCLVYYELGGIAYRHEVVLYRLGGGRAIKRWSAELQSAYKPATLAQLRKVIQHRKYYTPFGSYG